MPTTGSPPPPGPLSEMLEPPPPRFNMAAYAIGRAAAERPWHPALIVVDDASGAPAETWSFEELERAVLGIAGGLERSGLQRGDRILIRLDNTSTYALLFFGAIAGGFVPLPASRALTPREAQFLLEDSAAAVIALGHGLGVERVPDGVIALSSEDVAVMARSERGAVAATYADTAADDPAYLIYTSGTTSKPKGVLHAHRAAWGRRPMYQGWYGITPDDRMLHAGAFNWTFTIGTGLTDPWANGATAIVHTGEKTPQLWPRLIRATEATLFAAVPGVFRQMLKYAPDCGDLGRLRHALMAGETPPPGLFEEWRAATGREIHEALGMSEVSTYVSTAPGVPRRNGFVGLPQAGRKVAILPLEGGEAPLPAGREGLLAVHRSDPGLMLGYWRRPQEEDEVLRGDWFIGGDLARMDDDGYVAHLGRANDVMKVLGYRVSPQEVEAVVAMHPGVAEVACAEVEVREGVHVVGAFVVTRDHRALAEAELQAWCMERLAEYKRPRLYRFVEHLPRTANGKVRRADLST